LAGQDWEGVESHLLLQGRSRRRKGGQLRLPGWVLEDRGGDWHEHKVLVTSWEEKELLAG
jgi:hypothetical protein